MIDDRRWRELMNRKLNAEEMYQGRGSKQLVN